MLVRGHQRTQQVGRGGCPVPLLTPAGHGRAQHSPPPPPPLATCTQPACLAPGNSTLPPPSLQPPPPHPPLPRRALYERHGFICYEEFRVRPKAPPVFFMLREPRAHPAHPADTSHHKQQQAAGTSGGGHVHFGGEAGGKAPSSGGRGSLELRIPAVRSVQALEAAEQAATAAELCALRLGQLSPERWVPGRVCGVWRAPACLRGRCIQQGCWQPPIGCHLAAAPPPLRTHPPVPSRVRRCSSNESGDEAVFVSHANLPAPSAELVHAMSLKQAAATAMALAAAVLEEEQAEALLAAQQEQQQQGQQEAEQCTHGGGI